MLNRQRLLERFLRYVKIDTTAREDAEGAPSSPGQLELGRLLVEELRQAGASDAQQDQYGIVLATVPGTVGDSAPAIAFCAHLDTSPETSGSGVAPQVIEHYPGGDIVLPGDRSRVIRLADNPELGSLVGRTIVTSDGTTLLGADDKAGVAVIMEAAVCLLEDPPQRRGPCASASPATRRSAAAWTTSTPTASARQSVTRWTARGLTTSTWRPSPPTWPWSPSAA